MRPEGITLEEGVGPLGNYLVHLCRQKGCGARTLAIELGVPWRTLYHWLDGRKPRPAALRKLYAKIPALKKVSI